MEATSSESEKRTASVRCMVFEEEKTRNAENTIEVVAGGAGEYSPVIENGEDGKQVYGTIVRQDNQRNITVKYKVKGEMKTRNVPKDIAEMIIKYRRIKENPVLNLKVPKTTGTKEPKGR